MPNTSPSPVLLASVLEGFVTLKTQMVHAVVTQVEEVLMKFIGIKSDLEKGNHSTGHLFNPVRSFIAINETAHSRIIGDLLDPKGSHGQKNRFLQSFLRKLRVASPEFGEWTVTVEIGRIDICLVRTHPPSVVIVENKSNGAVDQDNQLYRYWYERIQRPHRPDYQKPSTKDEFKIVYLTPNDFKLPADHSVTRPIDWKPSDDTPDRIPSALAPICMSFTELMRNWRADVYPPIPDTNHRLRSFLLFYTELWSQL